jgi:cytochrome c peroxidase
VAGTAAGGGVPDAALAGLGRILFFDTGLSASGKLACATCHDPKFAYGPPPGQALAMGGPDMKPSETHRHTSLLDAYNSGSGGAPHGRRLAERRNGVIR